MPTEIIRKIKEQMPKFSKGQKLIANYIISHYDKAAFMTASRLGSEVNISESTVVRFANELGYQGYPDLQKSLQEIVRTRLTAVQRIEVANDRMGDDDILDKVLTSDAEKIKSSLENINRESFNAAVDSIIGAGTIYILGVRSSEALASFVNFYFNLIFENVKFIRTTSGSEMLEQLMRIKTGDVMIAISFPRYSKRIINAVDFGKSVGAKIVSITDSNLSPIAVRADHVLTAKSDMASFVDSLVAPLSIINALIVAIGKKKHSDVSETFSRLEKIWDEYDVYDKTDSELLSPQKEFENQDSGKDGDK